MAGDERTFTVATDDAVISMVQSARRRLVVIAPALSRAVAGALVARFDDLVLSRLRSGLSAHLGGLSFESQGAFSA